MGVRLPTAAEIENLRRVLEEEAHRSLKSTHTHQDIESVESKTIISADVEQSLQESAESAAEDDVEETVASDSVDDVASMTEPDSKAESNSKPASYGKSKKR
jgi:hypothetical protein